MNDTLRRIQAEAERVRSTSAESRELAESTAQRLHAAAEPLLRAFGEVENQFLRIEVLKRIWPDDFQQRNERARGLIAHVIGGERWPCGLRLHVPGGFRTFTVEENWDGTIVYVASRESIGTRPHAAHFDNPETWLASFYQTMATLLDV